MKRSRKLGMQSNPNFLPGSVCSGFQKELDQLVTDLAKTEGFKGAYLKSEYLSKYNGSSSHTAVSRRESAIAKWLSNDERNFCTNQRLQLGDVDFGWTHSDTLLGKAREIIRSILGPLPYPGVLTNFKHSNGASTRVSRSPSAAILKHGGIAHVSSRAVKHWLQAASNTQLSDQSIQIQEHSVLFTVPKNTEIDRPACKEPEINMLLQRSVGQYIRSRLKYKTGIDLRDQTQNQLLAKQALRLNLATIDLSAASDSVSRNIVMELLPLDWWDLLDDLRVHETLVGNDLHYLQMFSSMGNGFTFELETLIFYALARAICWLSGIRGKISVYGDDIVVPVKSARRLARVFSWLGFKVNSKKSAWTGSFRESCGRHYYGGIEVTPFYLRQDIKGKTDVIRILNRLLIWDSRDLRCFMHQGIMDFHIKWSRIIPSVLHGGIDPDSISSLVTGDKPRKRLIQVPKEEEFPQDLGLLYWLTAKESTFVDLELDPSIQGRWILSNHPEGSVRTAWDPYLLGRVF